jgi:hypothetical protein
MNNAYHPGPTPAPAPVAHPPQAVRTNTHQGVAAARTRQNVPEDPSLVNTSNRMTRFLLSYARENAARVISSALHDGDLLLPDPPRGPPVAGPGNGFQNQGQNAPTEQPHHGRRAPPVAGPSNFFHNQNQPAPLAQPLHGGMGYHPGPPPASAQPLNTGHTRAQEIDELRQFTSGVRYVRRPTTGYAGLPLPPAPPNNTPGLTATNAGSTVSLVGAPITGYAGLPQAPAPPNITPGFTAINAGSSTSFVGADPDASAAARAGWVGRRRRAAQTGDSLTSARGPDHSAGRADTVPPLVGVSRRRRAAPRANSNALAASGSNAGGGDGVPASRPVNGMRATRTQQGLAATSLRFPEVFRRTRENTMGWTSNQVANSTHLTVTHPDSAHTAASAGNAPVPVTATASAALASGSDDSDDVPLIQTRPGYARRGANRGAVTHGASAGEGAANVTKVDDQDSNTVEPPVTSPDASSAIDPATLAPHGSTGNATVPVNNTTESSSDGDDSPPHKRRKVRGRASGGTTGDKGA